MRNEIDFVIDKSRRAIKSAKREYEAGEYDYACSRAYYAAFYLLEGVLLLDKKRFTKHSAVISVFNKDYVKTGVLVSKMTRYPSWQNSVARYLLDIWATPWFNVRVTRDCRFTLVSIIYLYPLYVSMISMIPNPDFNSQLKAPPPPLTNWYRHASFYFS